MSDRDEGGKETGTLPDDVERRRREWARLMSRASEISEKIWKRQAEGDGFSIPDPMVVGRAFLDAWAHLLAEPRRGSGPTTPSFGRAPRTV